jgi:hypothetical protein
VVAADNQELDSIVLVLDGDAVTELCCRNLMALGFERFDQHLPGILETALKGSSNNESA